MRDMSGGTFEFPPPPPPPTSFSASAPHANFGSQNGPFSIGPLSCTQGYGDHYRGGGRSSQFSSPNHGRRQLQWGFQAQAPSANSSVQNLKPDNHRHIRSNTRSRNDFRGQYRGSPRARNQGFMQPRNIEVAPAIPSFGGPLPHLSTLVATDSHCENTSAKKKQKRSHNQLGLTPTNGTLEDSDKDTDDEARLATAHGVTGAELAAIWRWLLNVD